MILLNKNFQLHRRAVTTKDLTKGTEHIMIKSILPNKYFKQTPRAMTVTVPGNSKTTLGRLHIFQNKFQNGFRAATACGNAITGRQQQELTLLDGYKYPNI